MNLDDITRAVALQYAALPISFPTQDGLGEHSFNLRNMMRLSDEDRDRAQTLMAQFAERDEANPPSSSEMREALEELVLILADERSFVPGFLDAVGHDLATLVVVTNEYMNVTQAEKA